MERGIEAWDFLAHIEAGLVLAGKNEEGQLTWTGSKYEWRLYEMLETAHYEDSIA